MKLLAVDIGFANTGLAVMARDLKSEWSCLDLHVVTTKPNDKKRSIRKSDDDVARIQHLTSRISAVIDTYGITRMVVELPHGGALSARAIRAMALATGVIVAIAELKGMAVEWFSPNETRLAATGKTSNVSKDDVILAMNKLYPRLAEVRPLGLMEHAADALATFEAARSGNLVRL